MGQSDRNKHWLSVFDHCDKQGWHGICSFLCFHIDYDLPEFNCGHYSTYANENYECKWILVKGKKTNKCEVIRKYSFPWFAITGPTEDYSHRPPLLFTNKYCEHLKLGIWNRIQGHAAEPFKSIQRSRFHADLQFCLHYRVL